MQEAHIDCYMIISNWYIYNVIRIHLLLDLAENSKRSEMDHLRGKKTCTTTRHSLSKILKHLLKDTLSIIISRNTENLCLKKKRIRQPNIFTIRNYVIQIYNNH